MSCIIYVSLPLLLSIFINIMNNFQTWPCTSMFAKDLYNTGMAFTMTTCTSRNHIPPIIRTAVFAFKNTVGIQKFVTIFATEETFFIEHFLGLFFGIFHGPFFYAPSIIYISPFSTKENYENFSLSCGPVVDASRRCICYRLGLSTSLD